MSNTAIITITVLITFLSIFGIAYAVFSPTLSNKERANRRIKAVSKDGKTGTNGAKSKADENTKSRKKAVQEKLQQMESEQKQTRKSAGMKEKIQQAGLSFSLITFAIASAIIGVIVTLLVWISYPNEYLAAGTFFVASLGLPRWTIEFLAKRRRTAFVDEFANAVDIIVRGVKSGLPINECLQIIGNESSEPLASEFTELTNDIRVGVPFDQALERLYERMPIAELNFFVIVLTIQQQTGGNLAETLSNLSVVLRQRKIMKEKIKALSSEAKASAWIIGSLPPIVAVIITLTSPGYLKPLFETQAGNALVIGGIILMLSGILAMGKMVRFKY